MPKPMMRRRRRAPIAQKKANRNLTFDYKEPRALQRFIAENGAIVGRDMTGLSKKQQRSVTTQIKRARHLAMLPFTQTL